jgi:hypothetical protein
MSVTGQMPDSGTTPALGGERRIRTPDPIARDYLLLALRLDQHAPGLVDGYYGPADLKAEVDIAQFRAPALLAEDVASLRARVAEHVEDSARRAWLEAQLVALETQARALAGEALPYLDHVARCFDWRPTAIPEAELEAAAEDLDALLPGNGQLADRLAAWEAGLTVPVERLPSIVDWLVGSFRDRAAATFGLPAGERLAVQLVRDKPWSGYNWYLGGMRSRVELNVDLPIRAPDLIRVVAHETYPGHHLEHASKEASLVDGRGWLEGSVLLINTPECLISEGLANLAIRFAAPRDEEVGLLAELLNRAGVVAAGAASEAASLAEQAVAIRPARNRLGASAANAAILAHVEGRSRDDVVDYLVSVGRSSMERAEQRADFILHPLWRTYVFVYHEGEALLGRWLDQPLGAGPRPAERFGWLLREPVTPSGIAAGLSPG